MENGERHFWIFQTSVSFEIGEREDCKLTDSMLRLAEHVAAEIALNTLANRGPSKALPSKVLCVRCSLWSSWLWEMEFKEGYIAKVGPEVVVYFGIHDGFLES